MSAMNSCKGLSTTAGRAHVKSNESEWEADRNGGAA